MLHARDKVQKASLPWDMRNLASIQEDPGSATIQALIEITYQAPRKLPYNLLRMAYAASRFGEIGFVLSGPTALEINRVLDDLVPCFPLDIPGVRYIRSADHISILKAAATAQHVFAPTRGGALRGILLRWGLPVKTLSEAHTFLNNKSRG
jgi:hypothetical protein